MTSNRSLKIVSEKGTALRTLNEMEAPAMRSEYRRPVFSKRRPVLSRGAVSLLAMTLMPASFAQNVQPDTITVKNWAVGQSTNPRVVANFVSITPLGQAVGWVAAWQDDKSWPGTVICEPSANVHNFALP
jgi:hypothetical protein